jgi:branched-chain amino acid aminotransferase
MIIFTTSISLLFIKIIEPVVNIPKIAQENKDQSENLLQLYEVIRVIDGIPVFLEDHLERLYNSAKLSGVLNLPKQTEIEEKLLKLITNENQQIGNIKLSFTISVSHSQPKRELNFIPHFYPGDDKYKTGVKVGLLLADRPNPQAKVQHMAIRNKANLIMSKENVFEVLLVDHDGNITEGSRSNIFFVKDSMLFTSQYEKVLKGITRKKILELCSINDIPVIKKDIPVKELGEFEAAFLTGSSPKVLPISAIGEVRFDSSNPLIKRIIDLYDKAIEEYLEEKRHSMYPLKIKNGD